MKNKPNFDGATHKFSRCIYESAKGKVRLKVLKRDLAQLHAGPKLRVLDVGVGMGQMAVWFAKARHEVVACDVSAEMLEQTQQLAQNSGVTDSITYHHSSLQELPESLGQFDLVICHAVLEWIEEQSTFIQLLAQRLKPGAYLSLMAFNRKALLFNHLVAGNFEYAQSGMKRRSRQRLTPNWPVEPKALNSWIEEQNLSIEFVSGVRVFSDFVRDKQQVEQEEEAVLELELSHSRDPDWYPIARYLHYFLKSPEH